MVLAKKFLTYFMIAVLTLPSFYVGDFRSAKAASCSVNLQGKVEGNDLKLTWTTTGSAPITKLSIWQSKAGREEYIGKLDAASPMTLAKPGGTDNHVYQIQIFDTTVNELKNKPLCVSNKLYYNPQTEKFTNLTSGSCTASLKAEEDGNNIKLSWTTTGSTPITKLVIAAISEAGAQEYIGKLDASSPKTIAKPGGKDLYVYQIQIFDTADNELYNRSMCASNKVYFDPPADEIKDSAYTPPPVVDPNDPTDPDAKGNGDCESRCPKNNWWSWSDNITSAICGAQCAVIGGIADFIGWVVKEVLMTSLGI